MDATRYKIVFDGALMPQTPLQTAKENLARLFKSDPAKVDALFSGQPVVLKRDLSEDEAEKYLRALHSAGANARKEADRLAGLSLVETEDHPSPARATAPTADAQRMTCPKCGHEQDKASECSSCGIIIDKYLARQAELAASPPAQPAATPAPAAAQSPYAPPQAQVGDVLPEYGELKYISASGRIGRVRYLGWGMGAMFLMLPVFAVFAGLASVSSSLAMVLLIVAVAAYAVIAVLFGIQRLHDIGLSGWLWLVNLVPVVGSVMGLVMLLMPGNAGANRYGPPPPPNSRGVVVLAWSTALVAVIGILAAFAIPSYQDYVTREQLSHYSQDSDYGSGEDSESAAPDESSSEQ
ncbi:DUF805 domain-containing protein [Pseudomonas schmalbachii]|uniref:DUF805 domain-containing protein n=1 Tax=Pseudomonas schmalbachii TaxID=2816993 RepID=A0ABS3TV70_9PSED|nr:DUF805 domain-containing protein [Pseudomonas schmalbachii]MBO3277581.1 DUF805 domain-containing protein [Pseudomonas schmalbachii]